MVEILSYHYKARVSFDELRNNDWIIQINGATEDAVVTADADGTLSAMWLANGYSDTLDLDRNATYIVMRQEFSNETTTPKQFKGNNHGVPSGIRFAEELPDYYVPTSEQVQKAMALLESLTDEQLEELINDLDQYVDPDD